MLGVFSNTNDGSLCNDILQHDPRLQASSSPIPRIRISLIPSMVSNLCCSWRYIVVSCLFNIHFFTNISWLWNGRRDVIYQLLNATCTLFLGNLSRVLQDYAKSVIHNRLHSVAEEKDSELEPLPTPPSLVPEEDQAGSPTEDKTSLTSLKTQTKTSVEVILRKIKPQVHHLLWPIDIPVGAVPRTVCIKNFPANKCKDTFFIPCYKVLLLISRCAIMSRCALSGVKFGMPLLRWILKELPRWISMISR